MTRISSQGLHRLEHGRPDGFDPIMPQILQPLPAGQALEHGPSLGRVGDLGEDYGPQFGEQGDPVAEGLVELALQKGADLVREGRSRPAGTNGDDEITAADRGRHEEVTSVRLGGGVHPDAAGTGVGDDRR